MQVTTITDIPLEQEPVSVALAAAYCKVAVPVMDVDTLTPEGELVKLMLVTAREWCENYTQRSFGPKTIKAELTLSQYRNGLPYGPNVVVTEVLNDSGEVQSLDMFGANYYEYQRGFTVQNSYVDEFGFGGGWLHPAIVNEELYTVTYTAGYTPETVPKSVKQAILKTCVELYNNRENTVIGTIVAELPFDAKALLNPHRSNVVFV
jgi:hypothetical protein